MLRWILDDTRALLSDLHSLGRRLSTRWQWMRQRSRRRLDEAAAELENVRRGAETRTRMCRQCRALIPVSARRCPECGEAPGQPISTGMARVLENMVPGFLSSSSAILTLMMAGYLVSLLVFSNLSADLPPPIRERAWEVTLIALGANNTALVLGGEVWRLLTMVFLHGNVLHMVMNCWALLAVGPFVEENYGARKFLLIYLTSGVFGSIASLLWHSEVGVGIGASGAIFGLIGVAAVWGWRRGGSVGAGVRGQMVQWMMYALVMGLLIPGVDNAAHLGGLISGAVFALVITDGEPRSSLASIGWTAAGWFCGLLVFGCFVIVGLRHAETVTELVEILTRS